MSQIVKYLKLEDLVLWSENPRDPIDDNATDGDIIESAIEDKKDRWVLKRLAQQMGASYDFSEIPTVVYHNRKPVVYDGNRRVVLGKLFNNLVDIDVDLGFALPTVPLEIPCNICDKVTALKHIWRKHGDSGSWHPLERDIFIYKHMSKPKSTFLLLEEHTGIITKNPSMNKVFVKNEIFKSSVLNDLGFYIEDEVIKSHHNKTEVEMILNDVVSKVETKAISTRENRGQIFGVLDPSTKKTIISNANNRKTKVGAISRKPKAAKKKKTRRTKAKYMDLFGAPLLLKHGNVNDLYRDIDALFQFDKNPNNATSSTFHVLIRMALRLLCETAAKDEIQKLDDYVTSRFDNAKTYFDKDMKTMLANQNVKKSSIVQLLQTGAHSYKLAINKD